MRITVVCAGVAGAEFACSVVPSPPHEVTPDTPRAAVTVIASTGGDISLFGLRMCPDLDLVTALLAPAAAPAPPSYAAHAELVALGAGPSWYPVDDRALAVHVARTRWLAQGATLSAVTQRLARRCGLDDRGVRLLPMTDSPVETHVVLEEDGAQRAVHVQEWLRRLDGRPVPVRVGVAGLDRAPAAPGVLDAIRQADVVLLAPGDPVLGTGVVLGVPGVRDALRGTTAPVIGIDPLAAGDDEHAAVVRTGLGVLGLEPTSAGVAGLLTDLLDGWVGAPGATGPSGLPVRTAPVAGAGPARWDAAAAAALELAASLGR